MKLNEKYRISEEFKHLFEGYSAEEELQLNAQNISARFISEIDRICLERQINKTRLAKDLGVTKSYITQLLRGSKLVNMMFISKIEDYLKITFDIKADAALDKSLTNERIDRFNSSIVKNAKQQKRGAWVYFSVMPQIDNAVNKTVKRKGKAA